MTPREYRDNRIAAEQEAADSKSAADSTRRRLAAEEAEQGHDEKAADEARKAEIAAFSRKGIITDAVKGVQYTVVEGVIVVTPIFGIDDDLDGVVQPPVDVEPAPIEDEPFDTSGIPSDTPSVNVEITS